MVKIAVLANLVTYIFMHLRYNLWQMISLHSLGGCVRIKGWVCYLSIFKIKAWSLKVTYGHLAGHCDSDRHLSIATGQLTSLHVRYARGICNI